MFVGFFYGGSLGVNGGVVGVAQSVGVIRWGVGK